MSLWLLGQNDVSKSVLFGCSKLFKKFTGVKMLQSLFTCCSHAAKSSMGTGFFYYHRVLIPGGKNTHLLALLANGGWVLLTSLFTTILITDILVNMFWVNILKLQFKQLSFSPKWLHFLKRKLELG